MYCTQRRPPVFTPHPFYDPSPAELRCLAHRRFYGALLLRDLGLAGDSTRFQTVITRFGADRGELQRFWENAELYLKLVKGMCNQLNWVALTRLLTSLQSWFKSHLPRSFSCFLQPEDSIPFPALPLLARKELTVRDIAEMQETQLTQLLVSRLALPFGVTRRSLFLSSPRESGESVEQLRRNDYEFFCSDMARVAAVLKQRAYERRLELLVSREISLEKSELSVLVSPLVSDGEAMLNALENGEQSEGERSDGVLSASDEVNSEVMSEDVDDESKEKESSDESRIYVAEEEDNREDDVPCVKRRKCEIGENLMTFDSFQHYVNNDIQVGMQKDYRAIL